MQQKCPDASLAAENAPEGYCKKFSVRARLLVIVGLALLRIIARRLPAACRHRSALLCAVETMHGGRERGQMTEDPACSAVVSVPTVRPRLSRHHRYGPPLSSLSSSLFGGLFRRQLTLFCLLGAGAAAAAAVCRVGTKPIGGPRLQRPSTTTTTPTTSLLPSTTRPKNNPTTTTYHRRRDDALIRGRSYSLVGCDLSTRHSLLLRCCCCSSADGRDARPLRGLLLV